MEGASDSSGCDFEHFRYTGQGYDGLGGFFGLFRIGEEGGLLGVQSHLPRRMPHRSGRKRRCYHRIRRVNFAKTLTKVAGMERHGKLRRKRGDTSRDECDRLLTSHPRACCQGDVKWLTVTMWKFSTSGRSVVDYGVSELLYQRSSTVSHLPVGGVKLRADASWSRSSTRATVSEDIWEQLTGGDHRCVVDPVHSRAIARTRPDVEGDLEGLTQ